jgi:CheY-like chemotaxis protein
MSAILLVDSDADTREMYAEFLRARGCTVTVAASGDEALLRLGSEPVGLLITEIALPGTDGIALCREVRAHAAWRRLPILVLTAMAHPHYIARAKVAGANRILLKPAGPDEVHEQALLMIARWPAVTRQAAALRRVAADLATRISAQPGGASASALEWDALTTGAGTPIGATLSDRSGLHIGVNRAATELTGFSHTEMTAKSIWDLLPASRREESRAVWRWFQGTGRLAGSVTILSKNGRQKELQYLTLGDVVRGAHLSVFVPHPFELAPESGLQRHG